MRSQPEASRPTDAPAEVRRTPRPGHGRRTVAVLVCAAGIGLSVFCWQAIQAQDREGLEHDFERAAGNCVLALSRRAETDRLLLESLAAFYEGSERVERDEFRVFVSPFLREHKCFQALEWLPRVTQAGRSEFEAEAARDGVSGLQITERDPQGRMVPASSREEYFPVRYAEPASGNERSLGFDMASEPQRRRAMQIARDTGQMHMTGRVATVQEAGNQARVLVFMPVYAADRPSETVEDRRRNLRGFVVEVIRVDVLVEQALASLAREGVDLKVYDGPAAAEDRPLRTQPCPLCEAVDPAEIDREMQAADMRREMKLPMPGGTWSVVCTPCPEFLAARRSWNSWAALIGGLLATGALAAYLFAADANARRQKRAQDALQESRQNLQTILETVDTGILVIDPRTHRIADANRSAAEQIGLPKQQIVGRTCHGTICPEPVGRCPVTDLGQGIDHAERCLLKADGTEMPVLETVRPVLLNGREYLLACFVDLSAQRQAKEALAESDTKYRALYQTSADAIMTVSLDDRKGFLGGNPAAVRLFGCRDEQEFIGQSVESLSPAVQPDGRTSAEVLEEVRANVTEHDSYFFDWRHRRLDGTEFDARVHLALFTLNGEPLLQATVRDITGQRRWERELAAAKETAQRENAKLSAMISGMNEGVVFADAEGTVIEVNDFFCRFTNLPREAILGRKLDKFHSGPVIRRIREQIDRFRGDPRCEPFVLQRSLAGAEVILRMQPIYRQDRYDGVLLNIIDVTELVMARRDAEAANRAKSSFLARMSHEIRTPMTAILGYADLLADRALSPSDRDNHLAVIRRNGEHLLQLINDILDLSKIEAGKLAVHPERCALVSLVADVASTMRVRADYQGNRLDVEYVEQVPRTILTDGARLRQALMNLVGNAIKFTNRGTVRIVVRFLPDGLDGQPAVQFQVIDTGIGIEPEKLARLFQPFVQADDRTASRFGGTGLGLTITKHIVEMLGGQVSAESTPGSGSTFTMTVPTGDLAEDDMLSGPQEAMDRQNRHAPDRNALAGVRVLLAEDGPDNQRLICIILGKAGARVEVAANGRLAVELAEKQPFDAILMDMQMPEMDGCEATRVLRARGYGGPIIALTANAMSSDRERCLAAGCNEYLTKPIDHHLLVRTLARYAEPRPGQAGHGPSPAAAADAAAPAALRSQYADDPDMGEAIETFLAGLPSQIDGMRSALAGGAHEHLRRSAHQLKGSGGSYGYPQLSDMARELETAAAKGDAEAAHLAIGRLTDLCRAAIAGRQPDATRSEEA